MIFLYKLSFTCLVWTLVFPCGICEHAVAHLPGDIMIGGIFPIHDGVSNLLDRPNANGFTCVGLQVRNMVQALSMIHAIEVINNSTLLPGITLGYEIYDSCSDGLKATEAAMMLINPSYTITNTTMCNKTEVLPAVKAVIGEIYSEFSIAISRSLSLYFIPQISAASSADILGDKMRFPSFLRTCPSDKHQTRAIVELIRTFGWNWVGVITSDDDYGRSALDLLNVLFKAHEICTAFSRTVPSNVENPSLQSSLKSSIEDLKSSKTKVVILFAKNPIVFQMIELAISMNISNITWIGSDAWISSNIISSIKNIEKIGSVLGFNFNWGPVPGFVDYLKNINPSDHGATNEFLEEYKELRFGCTEEYREYLQCINSSSLNCTVPDSALYKSPLACIVKNAYLANDDYLVQNREKSTVYTTSLAVTAIAQALQHMLCNNETCDKNLQVTSRELLLELKKPKYFYNGEPFQFDSSGEVQTGYILINWQWNSRGAVFQTAGAYDSANESIHINKSLIVWNTEDNLVPFSNCSVRCQPGYYKKHSLISCCYECVPCPEQYYSPAADMIVCLKCPDAQWSNNGSAACENRTIEYFEWKDPYAVTLVTFAALGFLVVIVTGVMFWMNVDTPAVKAAGGKYTYVLMISLLFSLVSIGFFIGKPSDTICNIRQPLYGISFTIAVACILIKSIRILLVFKSAQKINQTNKSTYSPATIIIVLTGVQLCLCIIWLSTKGPFSTQIDTTPQIRILQCNEGSYVAFAIMLGYIGLLALICFLLAYKGRKLPEKYNEARCITFSMLVYMFVWILFIPVYVNATGKNLSTVQAVAILTSIYGMISCHLLPTVYIILFKRKTNNRKTYIDSICSFYRARRRILSIPHGKSNLKASSITPFPNTEIINCSQTKSLDSISQLTKRRNSS